MRWGLVAVAMAGFVSQAHGQQSFLTPGTWEVAAVRNDKFTLTLQVASVSAQGVTGTLGANPYSKCQEAMPVTSSQVEPTRVIVRFLHSENPKIPNGCDRTLTFLNNNGQISVVIDNWNGRNDMKVVKHP